MYSYRRCEMLLDSVMIQQRSIPPFRGNLSSPSPLLGLTPVLSFYFSTIMNQVLFEFT